LATEILRVRSGCAEEHYRRECYEGRHRKDARTRKRPQQPSHALPSAEAPPRLCTRGRSYRQQTRHPTWQARHRAPSETNARIMPGDDSPNAPMGSVARPCHSLGMHRRICKGIRLPDKNYPSTRTILGVNSAMPAHLSVVKLAPAPTMQRFHHQYLGESDGAVIRNALLRVCSSSKPAPFAQCRIREPTINESSAAFTHYPIRMSRVRHCLLTRPSSPRTASSRISAKRLRSRTGDRDLRSPRVGARPLASPRQSRASPR